MKTLVKKFGRVEALLHKNLVCLKPRLERRYGYLVYPEGLTVKAIKEQKNNFWDFIKHGNAEDAHVEVIEDCFDYTMKNIIRAVQKVEKITDCL